MPACSYCNFSESLCCCTIFQEQAQIGTARVEALVQHHVLHPDLTGTSSKASWLQLLRVLKLVAAFPCLFRLPACALYCIFSYSFCFCTIFQEQHSLPHPDLAGDKWDITGEEVRALHVCMYYSVYAI